MKKIHIYILVLFVAIACNKPVATNSYSVLPLPQNIELNNKTFALSNANKLIVDAPEEDKRILEEYMTASLSEFANNGKGTIRLVVKESVAGVSSHEGYSMTIAPKEITVEATSGAGLFYGIQTILQMARENSTVACGKITDEPAFAYRGLMLDVSRHFFDKEFIKKQIDAIAHFKMNRLHLHLTDAAGWRTGAEITELLSLSPKPAISMCSIGLNPGKSSIST